MRRRRCGKLYGGSSHLLLTGPAHRRSIASSITMIAICAFDTYIDAPGRGGPCRNIAMTFDTEKTRMVWLPDGEKI